MVLIIAIVLIIICLLVFISISNQIKKVTIKIDEANSLIDIALTKRYDVINSMVEVVKGYTKHEKEVLFEIVKLRKNMTINELVEENNKLTDNYDKVNLTVENYPELKSSANFLKLQETIEEVEDLLLASRRMYNSNVSIYNQMISVFPNTIVSKIFGYKKKDFFTAKEAATKDLKIDINM